MPRSVLLDYSVELEDGKITVSLSGSMASQVLAAMGGSRFPRGRNTALLAPFQWLGSTSVALAPLLEEGGGEQDDQEDGEGPEDLRAVFGQGFDSSYGEFEQRLSAYRSLIETPMDLADAPPAAESKAAARPAGGVKRNGKSRRKSSSRG